MPDTPPADLAARFERILPWVRSHFPQLECLRNGDRRIYLDNAAGTLMPRSVSEAMAEAALWANPQPGRAWPAGPETLRAQRRARELLAGFLNASDGDRIYLSESTTSSLYKLREGLEPRLPAGANVVVTDCDHFANISPWEWRAGWEVRRARMAPDGGLDLEHLESCLDDQTQVVALTAASNGLGNVIRLDAAIPLVRRRSPRARVVVDAVHGAPHLPLDVRTLDADAVAFSTYKLFGPNNGVLWLAGRLAAELEPFRVEPHTDPETLLEWGTLSNVAVGGITACLEYLLRLGEKLEPAFVGRLRDYPRERRLFKVALEGARAHEGELSRTVLTEMAEIAAVRVFGEVDPDRCTERVPTFAFEVEGVPDPETEARLWELMRLQVAAGNHYSGAVARGLGRGSVVRASFAHYNNAAEAEALITALRSVS